MTHALEAIDWYRFLARPCLPSPTPAALDSLRSERILITGAGGSIGSALALRLAALLPEKLVLLEASESHLFALQNAFTDAGIAKSTDFILGNVTDPVLLDEIMTVHAPSLIFHAAAFKQVPLLETQPFAAIENNIFGTQALVAANENARIVLLSTDKAVEPASVMGATKRVAEHIVTVTGGTVLRLGNVLASRDSVAEIFAAQIGAGGPLTVTDPAARRYFLTIGEAVSLLLAAAVEPQPSLLAPALPAPHFIADLARFMALELAPGRELPIDFTHPRPGEKETERLWSLWETARTTSSGLLSIESPQIAQLPDALAALRAAVDLRKLPAALADLRALVPNYTASRTVLALAGQSDWRVAR